MFYPIYITIASIFCLWFLNQGGVLMHNLLYLCTKCFVLYERWRVGTHTYCFTAVCVVVQFVRPFVIEYLCSRFSLTSVSLLPN